VYDAMWFGRGCQHLLRMGVADFSEMLVINKTTLPLYRRGDHNAACKPHEAHWFMQFACQNNVLGC